MPHRRGFSPAAPSSGSASPAGNRNSSMTVPSTAAFTISSTGSPDSAFTTCHMRAWVSGLRGVNNWQQSWSGMMEIS